MANESMGLIGKKLGMTQIFKADGTVLPVTVVQVGPCTVLQVKSADGADGYNALQLGFDEKKESRGTKAEIGHAKKVDAALPKFAAEIRVSAEELAKHAPGSTVSVTDIFNVGDFTDAIGTSKGKGFAGVMKRYNFQGFIRSHGSHEFFRHGGSIGTRLTPGHVLKGKKMPGHMGAVQVTVQNLLVERVDAERNLIFLKGGVPGPTNGYVTIRHAVKK